MPTITNQMPALTSHWPKLTRDATASLTMAPGSKSSVAAWTGSATGMMVTVMVARSAWSLRYSSCACMDSISPRTWNSWFWMARMSSIFSARSRRARYCSSAALRLARRASVSTTVVVMSFSLVASNFTSPPRSWRPAMASSNRSAGMRMVRVAASWTSPCDELLM